MVEDLAAVAVLVEGEAPAVAAVTGGNSFDEID